MSLAGKFSTMSMADLIQWGRTAHRTGLLRLSDGRGKEIQVTLRDGRIVFSGTNDKREQWSGYLIYHGYCSREDVEEAFALKEVTGASLGSILVHEKKITEQQALSTLTEKTIEDLCDVFLWPDGEFTFEPRQPPTTTSLGINLDPIHVMCEGVRRAEVWNRMSAFIHPRSLLESTEATLDEGATWEDQSMARHVLAQIDSDVTVDDLVERLPFSRYKIYRAVAELLEQGLVRHCDVTSVEDREKRLWKKVEDADRAVAAERWTAAIEILQGLIAANPGRADLVQKLLEVTRGFERSIYSHNFTKDDVPVVTIGPEALARVNIYPTEGFLLSRIDGRLTVRDILRITPVSEIERLRALRRLLSAKVIDFPVRRLDSLPAAAQRGG